MTFEEYAHKKVAGVPIIYLAGGFVIILAIVAWKLKPSTTDTTTATTPDATGGTAADNAIDPSAYSGLATNGTVIVAPQSPPTDTPNSSIATNQDWVQQGVQWLVGQNKADGTTAVTALSKYINDQDRTYDENVLINLWIKQAGPPPDGVAGTGSIGASPAKKQFDQPPGTHTVTNANDNSLSAIATLYYGNGSSGNVDLLQFANPPLGTANINLPVGTKVNVPVYHDPKNWTVSSNMTWAQAASKNGITETQLHNLNNGTAGWRNAPVLKKGQVIRVA